MIIKRNLSLKNLDKVKEIKGVYIFEKRKEIGKRLIYINVDSFEIEKTNSSMTANNKQTILSGKFTPTIVFDERKYGWELQFKIWNYRKEQTLKKNITVRDSPYNRCELFVSLNNDENIKRVKNQFFKVLEILELLKVNKKDKEEDKW